MCILVTGATGFIGNHVVNELLLRNIDVIAASKEHNISRFHWAKKVKYFQHDIGSSFSEEAVKAINGANTCIHLAWGSLPDYKTADHINIYPEQHFRFLESLINLGVKKLIVAGTCLEYGMIEGELNENLEPKPVTAYGIGKLELLNKLLEFQKINYFELTWVRLFYMYGEGQNPNSLISLLEKAIDKNDEVFNMSEGLQERDYLPVKTATNYIVDLSLRNKGSGLVNCCSGKPIMVLDLVNRYIKEKNADIQLNCGFYPYPDYEPFKFWGSNKKLLRILNEKE